MVQPDLSRQTALELWNWNQWLTAVGKITHCASRPNRLLICVLTANLNPYVFLVGVRHILCI